MTFPKYQLALITGASSGIGAELAKQLALKGIPLLLTGRDKHKLEELAATLSAPAMLLPLDLTQRSDRNKLISAIREYVPDLIINNAGFGLYGNALSNSVSEQLQMITLNIEALTEISLISAKVLVDRKGKGTIVNISSVAAFIPIPCFAIYAASKTFVNHFSEALDLELSQSGVRILTMCPGQVDTSFRIRASKGQSKEKSPASIPVEKAVKIILSKIASQKRVAVIYWSNQIKIALMHCIPKSWIMSSLKNKMSKL